jgi:hypothetical protein
MSPAEALGDAGAGHITPIRQAHQVALIAQRADQVIGRGQAELAPAGDDLHRQRARRAGYLLHDPQGTGHTADKV